MFISIFVVHNNRTQWGVSETQDQFGCTAFIFIGLTKSKSGTSDCSTEGVCIYYEYFFV
jgi:hypothetical protein